MRQCPLCGNRFTEEEQARSCQRCPFAFGCQLVRCPACGYEWPEDSQFVNWMKRAWGANTEASDGRASRAD